jgi:hypothetical protein
VKAVSYWKADQEKGKRRPRLSWMDEVEFDLRDMGIER